MIIVLGSAAARAGCIDEALALSHEHVLRSRAEPGCIAHSVYQDPEDASRLVFVEQWADQAALWDHFKVPASRMFAKALAGLAQEAPGIAIYESTEVHLPGRTAT